jgi:hypothetical protein
MAFQASATSAFHNGRSSNSPIMQWQAVILISRSSLGDLNILSLGDLGRDSSEGLTHKKS